MQNDHVANFWEKTPQVHLIIIREWLYTLPRRILRNPDNFPPGEFYSIPPPQQLGIKE